MTRLLPLPGRSPAHLTSPISEAPAACPGQPARAEPCSPRVPGMSFEIGGESPVLGP
jgi:hypothetical protein